MKAPSALVVDDEIILRKTIEDTLVDRGWKVTCSGDGLEAMELIGHNSYDVIITDLRLPGATGLEILRASRIQDPFVCVILMTAYGTIQIAIQAVRDGAFHYLTKPFDLDELVIHVDRAQAQRELRLELERARATARGSLGGLVDRSPKMRKAVAMAYAVAQSEASVLLFGETGSGKEVMARAIHEASSRRDGPLVPLNCSAVPEALFESELFGAEKGAFTGASEVRDGKFLAAHGGTLFLDEIGDLPLALQAKLLRALEEGVIHRLGSNVPIPVNVRILAATHRDLRQMVAQQRFRDDLYFRLNVVALEVPPLRDRREDLPELTTQILTTLSRAAGRSQPPQIAPECYELLAVHAWPGNIRELKNVLTRALVLAGDIIQVEHLPPEIDERAQRASNPKPVGDRRGVRPLADVLSEAEHGALLEAIRFTGGNRSEAARLLGISRKHLWELLKRHGI